MSVQKKLSTDVQWGTTGAGTLSAGKILSCTKKSTAKTFEQTDEDDELHSLLMYDQREEVSVEILAKAAGSTQPMPGDTATVAGVTDMIVMEGETVWKKGDTVKYNATLMKSTA
jgi:hypothetical protein